MLVWRLSYFSSQCDVQSWQPCQRAGYGMVGRVWCALAVPAVVVGCWGAILLDCVGLRQPVVSWQKLLWCRRDWVDVLLLMNVFDNLAVVCLHAHLLCSSAGTTWPRGLLVACGVAPRCPGADARIAQAGSCWGLRLAQVDL